MASHFFDPRTGQRDDIAAFEPDLPQTRLNDGRTDRQGNFIAGGMDEKDLAPISSVWRLDPDLNLTQLFGSVRCANSTCFSPDGRTMYFADSPECEIVAFDYDPDNGALGGKRTVATLPSRPACPTAPASTPRASSGTPSGKAIALSASRPTAGSTAPSRSLSRSRPAVAFGGPDLDTLFITTSRLGATAEILEREPHPAVFLLCGRA